MVKISTDPFLCHFIEHTSIYYGGTTTTISKTLLKSFIEGLKSIHLSLSYHFFVYFHSVVCALYAVPGSYALCYLPSKCCCKKNCLAKKKIQQLVSCWSFSFGITSFFVFVSSLSFCMLVLWFIKWFMTFRVLMLMELMYWGYSIDMLLFRAQHRSLSSSMILNSYRDLLICMVFKLSGTNDPAVFLQIGVIFFLFVLDCNLVLVLWKLHFEMRYRLQDPIFMTLMKWSCSLDMLPFGAQPQVSNFF